MHPAPSVIAFTTLSGLGFGLLFWLGLGYPNVTGTTAWRSAGCSPRPSTSATPNAR